MSDELIVGGDAASHLHDLPVVPSIRRSVLNGAGSLIEITQVLPNAVAQCLGCGRLFVSRDDPDGWGPTGQWVRLRWWHRKAQRKLRERARRAETRCDCTRARPVERDLTGHRYDCPLHPPKGWPHG